MTTTAELSMRTDASVRTDGGARAEATEDSARDGSTREASSLEGCLEGRWARPADQLELVTDALPALVALLDHEERYLFVSAAYERWYHRPKTEFLGRKLEEVIGSAAYERIERHVKATLEGQTVRYEADLHLNSRGKVSIDATYVPQRSPEGLVTGFVALVTDVTERRAWERAQAKAAERAEKLVKITAAIAAAVSREEVYGALVDDLADTLSAHTAALWVVDQDDDSTRLARSRGYPEGARRLFDHLPLATSLHLPLLDAIKTREPVWLASQELLFAAYPHLREVAPTLRDHRVAALPLVVEDRVLGVLALTISNEHEPSPDERDFLLLVARYASQALERLRLFERERRHRAEAEHLYTFAERAVVADSVDAACEAALSTIESALRADRVAILTFDAEGIMRFRASRRLSETYRQAVEGHSPWSPDVVEPDPVLVGNVAEEPSLRAFGQLFTTEGIGALAFVPLLSAGRLIGKFMVYYDRPHVFAAHEVEVAVAIANHLGSVLSRFAAVAKLEETLRQNEMFAAVLAHDLRNPLSAIIAAAQVQLLRNRERQDEGVDRETRAAGRILSSAKRMTAMIDQLLDFTRSRVGGGIDIEPAATNLAELCAQVGDELELAHPTWKIVLDARGDQNGRWDQDRLLQMISNLVANAGEHGRPEQPIMVTLDGSRADRVSFEVQNQGTIAPELLPHLFEPFRGRHERRPSRGLGLGLYIVREIVRAHGGTVDVSSNEALGTSFLVRLPRHPVTGTASK